MLINLVESEPLCAAAETLLATLWLERHQSSFSCGAQDYHLSAIHYHYHNFWGVAFLSIVFWADKEHNMWLTENSEEILTVSIKSSVINVCHLLNLLWSWESIMPDIFSADISLPIVLCIVFPCWLSVSCRNLASLYRWCVRKSKLMVFTVVTIVIFFDVFQCIFNYRG